MVVSDRFIWMHFPKCAGTEVENVLRMLNLDKAKYDPIDMNHVIWHHTLEMRRCYDKEFSVAERDVICCFRRLPYWMLSMVHFEYARSSRFPDRDMFVKGSFLYSGGAVGRADSLALLYGEGVTKWIRTECLVEDFAKVFKAYLNIEIFEISKLFQRKNVNTIHYIKDLSFYFTPEDLEMLYISNPNWASLEKQLYGSLLHLPE